jgi:aminoglycoside 2''-phosphotransferase
LGEFLTALHRIPVAQALPIVGGSASPEDWRRQYEEMYTWIKDLAFPYLPKPDQLAASLLWEVYLSSADNFNFQLKLIHGDLGPEHILCQPDGSAICGVIDWGDARLGDPALDFAGLFSMNGERLVDWTLSFYQGPVDETFRRRVRFYHTIAPFYEIRYALGVEDETRLKRAIESINTNLRV